MTGATSQDPSPYIYRHGFGSDYRGLGIHGLAEGTEQLAEFASTRAAVRRFQSTGCCSGSNASHRIGQRSHKACRHEPFGESSAGETEICRTIDRFARDQEREAQGRASSARARTVSCTSGCGQRLRRARGCATLSRRLEMAEGATAPRRRNGCGSQSPSTILKQRYCLPICT